MEKQLLKICNRYHDADGLWIGPKDYMVTINGEQHDYRELAKDYDIKYPTPENGWSTKPSEPNAPTKPNKKVVNVKLGKQINTDKQETSYGDMEQTLDPESAEEHGDGDSKSTE